MRYALGMGGGTEDDAEAPTLAQTAPDRTSRPSIAQPLPVGAVVGSFDPEVLEVS